MKKAIFHLKRDTYRNTTTLGEMYDPKGNHFCYVLEDTVRGYGIKDKGNTAIPCTDGDFTYLVRNAESPKYGWVSTIFTDELHGMYHLLNGGIEFTMIRVHGGNDEGDTMGCLLVNKNRDTNKMKAWGSMKSEFAELVDRYSNDGYDVRLKITNLPQKS